MRFTPFALPLLAICVSASRHGGGHRAYHTEVVTITVTGERPAPTNNFHYYNPGSDSTPTTLATQVSSASSPAAPSGTGSSSDTNLDADQKAALDAHNAARAAVNVPALEWDSGLASDASSYAQQIASMNSLTHSGVSGQGENLYMQSNSDSPLTAAVNAFVSEKSQYNGQAITDSNYEGFGHYSMLKHTSYIC